MRKKTYFKKREHRGDPVHGRVDAGRFINYLMQDGKKAVAEKVFYQALEVIKETAKTDPVKIFETALENVLPVMEVGRRRIGGANYQVPQEVRPERKFFLAVQWIITAARARRGKPMAEKLAEELLAASKNEGAAIKKKQDTHRMAEANRAFAHFGKR